MHPNDDNRSAAATRAHVKGETGAIDCAYRVSGRDGGRRWTQGRGVDVGDNGGGIPPEPRSQIFVPFFTARRAGEGTGPGLSLSYGIVVKQHGAGAV